jgi:hypothetical protein
MIPAHQLSSLPKKITIDLLIASRSVIFMALARDSLATHYKACDRHRHSLSVVKDQSINALEPKCIKFVVFVSTMILTKNN